MNMPASNDRLLVFSYLEHRATIGLLGIALPFILTLGAMWCYHTGLQSSISAYYHTGMRDPFVGIIFAIGIFLYSYRGEAREDNIAGKVASLAAVTLALFPTAYGPDCDTSSGTIGMIHNLASVVFFASLIYFCLVLFVRTDPGKTPTPQKLQRNRVYRACGYTMAACLLLIAIYLLGPDSLCRALRELHPVYWLETLAILAFGLSWLTKGEALLKDQA